jgi:hypothetical protein
MAEQGPESPATRRVPHTHASSFGRAVDRYTAGFVIVAASTCAAWFVFGQSELADVVMVLLLGVVIVSMRSDHMPRDRPRARRAHLGRGSARRGRVVPLHVAARGVVVRGVAAGAQPGSW